MNQPTNADESDSVQPLLGPIALLCWIASLSMPALSAPHGWILGGEFLIKGLIAFPLALIFSPLLALAPFTNIFLLTNLVRLWSVETSALKAPNVTWVGSAFLFNCVALAIGSAGNSPVLGDIGRYPAMWLWLLSFLLLCMAITRSERGQTSLHGALLKDRWKLAIALACVLPIAGLTARAVSFPGPAINRSVSGVEGIEIQRSGVPARQYPLLEDGYLRQSKYKFFVLEGHTHESTPGGGWISRSGASPPRYVVHEAVESYRSGPEGPGRVLRSTITVYDGGVVIARKTFYEGMVEDGHGWVGAIALKFVQTVLQPAPNLASTVGQRLELLVRPLDLPSGTEWTGTKRRTLGCPSSVALNQNDWRELRTPQWSLQAIMNIGEVVCTEDSVLVVMGGKSGIYVDIISLGGRVSLQARASVSHPTDLYALEEVRASKGGWRVRLVGYRPGSSINVPTVPIERFELVFEPNKPS